MSAAARYIGISRSTLYQLVERGRVRTYSLRGVTDPLTGRAAVRVKRSDLDELMEKREP